MHDSMTVKQM